MKKRNIFYQTEQSTLYETRENTLIKQFNSQIDFENELKAYRHIHENNLIQIPRLVSIGELELEIEFLQRARESTTSEIVEAISPLYVPPDMSGEFRIYDLSKDKLIERVGYLRDEVDRRNVSRNILEKARSFIDDEYQEACSTTFVHGDLKPIHAISTKDGLKFVDFALYGVASPWYDIAFLHMAEKRGKMALFAELVELSTIFSHLSEKERESLLRSAIFNRTLYNLGYALRHRPDKSLERNIRDLNHIIDFEK